jgi:RNA polymerase primary sigma factor
MKDGVRHVKNLVLKHSLRPLSREEEFEIFSRYREAVGSDKEAIAKQIFLHNMRFAYATALKLTFKSKFDFDTLFSAMCKGMLEAIERFDHTRGTKFISYAIWWLRQASSHLEMTYRLVSIPPNKLLDNAKYRKQNRKAINQGLMPPDTDDMIKILSLDQSASWQDDAETDTANMTEASLASWADKPFENEVETLSHLGFLIEKATAALDDREKHVLFRLYGLNGNPEKCTLREISAELNLSHERIRQIKERALKKCMTYFNLNHRGQSAGEIIGQ